MEELLRGLVGIHVAFAERGIDLLVGVVPRDLLDVLDRPPHRRRDRNPSRRHRLPLPPAAAAAPRRRRRNPFPCPRTNEREKGTDANPEAGRGEESGGREEGREGERRREKRRWEGREGGRFVGGFCGGAKERNVRVTPFVFVCGAAAAHEQEQCENCFLFPRWNSGTKFTFRLRTSVPNGMHVIPA